MTQIKICGLSRDCDIDYVNQAAPDYAGFILRYPPDKTAITGVSGEEWHYRYVGREAAADIFGRGITLEEYLAEQEAGQEPPPLQVSE